jgi:hypothetical protein
MDEFVNMGFFSLLSESSQKVSNEEMRSAYGNFMEQLRTVSQSEQNYSEIFRMLNITRVELVFLKSLLNNLHKPSNQHLNLTFTFSLSRKTWGLLHWGKL